MRALSNHPPSLSNVEDLGIMLKPVEVSADFLGDVALAPSG